MNNCLKSVVIALCLSAGPVMAETTYEEDQLVIRAENITSIIQSSKAQYADWYLFVVTMTSLRRSPADGSTETQLEDVFTTPQTVEIMLPKSFCYHEILAASAWTASKMEMAYVKKSYLAATPDDAHHDYFLKLDVIDSVERDRAECIISK